MLKIWCTRAFESRQGFSATANVHFAKMNKKEQIKHRSNRLCLKVLKDKNKERVQQKKKKKVLQFKKFLILLLLR